MHRDSTSARLCAGPELCRHGHSRAERKCTPFLLACPTSLHLVVTAPRLPCPVHQLQGWMCNTAWPTAAPGEPGQGDPTPALSSRKWERSLSLVLCRMPWLQVAVALTEMLQKESLLKHKDLSCGRSCSGPCCSGSSLCHCSLTSSCSGNRWPLTTATAATTPHPGTRSFLSGVQRRTNVVSSCVKPLEAGKPSCKPAGDFPSHFAARPG